MIGIRGHLHVGRECGTTPRIYRGFPRHARSSRVHRCAVLLTLTIVVGIGVLYAPIASGTTQPLGGVIVEVNVTADQMGTVMLHGVDVGGIGHYDIVKHVVRGSTAYFVIHNRTQAREKFTIFDVTKKVLGTTVVRPHSAAGITVELVYRGIVRYKSVREEADTTGRPLHGQLVVR